MHYANKIQKCVTSDGEIISTVNLCLSNIFKRIFPVDVIIHLSSSISKVSDEINKCNSFIETQNTLIRLLQQDVTFLKNEFHKVCSTFPKFNMQRTSTSDIFRLNLREKLFHAIRILLWGPESKLTPLINTVGFMYQI